MKKRNRILSVLVALIMVLSVIAPTLSKVSADETKTNKVTLHKVLLPKDSTFNEGITGADGKKYNGGAIGDLGGFFGTGTKEIAGVFFAVKNEEGHYMKKDGSSLGAAFTLTEATKDQVLGGLTTAGGLELNTSVLPQNKPTKYEIVEVPELSTYVGVNGETLTGSKAVPVKITLPFVNENGTQEEVHVYPKNTEEKPEIDKNFENPGANYNNSNLPKDGINEMIGTSIPYQVKTKIPANAHYKKLVWTDIMTKGLTYNKDLVLSATGTTETFAKGTDYKLLEDNNGFTLTFTEAGLTKLTKEAKNGAIEFELKYSAKLNGDAIVDNPETNDISLDYGNKPDNALESDPIRPENGEIKVTKNWAGGNPPAGVKVVYTLVDEKSGVVVDSVVKTEAPWEHTFTGLDNSKQYKVIERVSGYDASYEVNGNGVVITNKKDTDNPTPLEPTEPEVETYGKKFVKTDNDGAKNRLQGAEFVVKNAQGEFLALKDVDTTQGEGQALVDAKAALDAAIDAYNALTADQQNGTEGTAAKDLIKQKQEAYNKAFKAVKNAYKWVTDDKDPNLVKLISDEEGRFEITGLKEGTYKLLEVKAPAGFANNNNEFEFTVGKGSYAAGDIGYNTGDTNNAQQVINKKVTIPQTGGIGTLIFIVGGLALMGGAFVAMKRRSVEE